MRTCVLLFVLTGVATLSARADFSYTSTRKMTGGAMAGLAGAAANGTARYYYKGQKMKVETGDTAIIMDFDAQTITTLDNKNKTASVKNFNDVAAAPANVNAKIDVKETGQKKTVNGMNASELVMTMDVDTGQPGPMGKMQMEVDMWISKDVPGASELRSFYQKNMAKFPWAALAGGNQGMQAGMVDLQRKVAEMDGVPVEQIVKMRSASRAGAPAMPQMTDEQRAKMNEAMARMAELQKQGGPAAAAAAQAMSRLGGLQGGPARGGSDSLMEMTMDSSGFSTESIPDSVFSVPGGYQKR